LSEPASSFGDLVYEGPVVPLGQDEPLFRYERRVQSAAEGRLQSTHLTFPVEGGSSVLLHRAVHSADYRLHHFEEIHGQTGRWATVDIESDGRVSFHVRHGRETRHAMEEGGAPVVVGPTLFGFVRAHLQELIAGEALEVRFAVTDQARTYAFVLRCAESDSHRTLIRMEASDFFVRLGIDAMEIEVDSTGNITRYRGRVPVLRPDLEAFDAEIHYRYFVPEYR
jgi:hypothetical protein